MSAIRVGVVRGGKGHEYEVSLQTGHNVLRWLPQHYDRSDILITKDGQWHWQGLPIKPAELAGKVDVVFNALHGEYGEDGRIQALLDQLGLPYTGSTSLPSAVAMKKVLAKQALARRGVKTPYGFLLTREQGLSPREAAQLVFTKLGPPWVIKPDDRGSSVGLQLVKQLNMLPAALEHALNFSDRVLVEEYIRGREATCGVINHFRDTETYVLPAIEIRRPQEVWHYNDKYSGVTEEVCPGHFNDEEKWRMSEIAALAHKELGLRHYSRSDFIVSPRGIYWLEVNTLPGLTQHSLLPKSLDAVGCSYDGFLDHLVNLALRHQK
jgi:D-alanine-D-alanine ligase